MAQGPEARLRRRILESLKRQNEGPLSHIEWWSNAMAYASGLPDLSVLCNGRFYGLELKAEDGRLSKLQEMRLVGIARSGCVAGVIRDCPKAPLKFTWARMGTDGVLTPPVSVTSKDWLIDGSID